MNSKSHKLNQELVIRYLDDDLSLCELDQLNQALRDSAELRSFLIEVSEHSIQADEAFGNLISQDASIHGAKREKQKSNRSSISIPVFGGLRFGWGGIAMALATVFLVSGVYYSWNRSKIQSQLAGNALGFVESQSGSFVLVSEDGTYHNIKAPGDPLVAGVLRSSSHSAIIKVRFKDGASMEFVGKGAVGLLKKDDTHLVLYHGTLAIDNTIRHAEASPFYIHTCHGEIESTQSRFVISSHNGDSFMEVEDGNALLSRRDSDEVLMLNSGESVAISPFQSLTQGLTTRSGTTHQFQYSKKQSLPIPPGPEDQPNSELLESHKVFGKIDPQNAFENRDHFNSTDVWMEGQAEVIDWPSSDARIVDLVHINVASHSDNRILIDRDSKIVITGGGKMPESMEVILHSRSMDSPHTSILHARIHDRNKDTKNVTFIKTLSEWQMQIPVTAFKDITRSWSPDASGHGVLNAFVFKQKSIDKFKLNQFSIVSDHGGDEVSPVSAIGH